MRRLALGIAVALGCGSSQTAGPDQPPPPAGDTDAAPSVSQADDEAEQVAAIEYAVNTTAEAVHACYKAATAERLDLEGVVTLGVEFGAGGVPAVTVTSDEPNSPALADCLVEVFTALKWPPVFSAGDVIQLPLSFVAAPAQYTVQSAHVATREVAPGLKAKVVLDRDSTGNDAAALTLLELGAGFEVPLHEHTSTEVLYVLEGGGTIYGVDGKRKGSEVGAGTAIYLPVGVPHAFSTGPDGARCVQLYAPGGAEQRFEGDTARTDTIPVDAKKARKLARKRRARRPLVAGVGVKLHEIGGGIGAVSILFDAASAGDDTAYIGVLTAEPEARVPMHAHEGSTELLYVLEGEAVMTVAGVEYPVEPGMGIQVPPETQHDFRVTSDTAVKVVQFYSPSGPEQRFKK